MSSETVYFFNNCKGRDHERLFGRDAFFDLGFSGSQETEATDLTAGQWCVVATKIPPSRDVTFRWYRYHRQAVMLDKENIRQRVLFGELKKWETLPQEEAAHHPLYDLYFNKAGHFLQKSTLCYEIPRQLLPEVRPDE